MNKQTDGMTEKIIYAQLQLSLDRWMDLYKILLLIEPFSDESHKQRVEFLTNAIKELIARNLKDK